MPLIQGRDEMGDHQSGHQDLQTARLSLRRPGRDDVDTIYRIHRDPMACAHNPADMVHTRLEAEDRYLSWDQHWQRWGFGYWVLYPRDGGDHPTPIGFCGVKSVRLADRDVLNLFYRLDPGSWGAGIATEAATAVVEWATIHLPDRPIIARVRPGNAASAAVATRAGLRRARHLDSAGEDGLDWIFVSRSTNDIAPRVPAPRRRPPDVGDDR